MTIPIFEDSSAGVGGSGELETREFLAEFDSPTAVMDAGLSIFRRPDTISLDYLTAYTLGPVQKGDPSLGAIERVWKIRSSGSTVWLARQGDDRVSFEPEVILFSYSADAATEVDASFDQNANVLVCMESPSGPGHQGELLIYFFDPFLGAYTLTNFGRGRTPRAILDDPVSSNGDILVFYVNDATGICYRQQRDRYAVEYIVPTQAPPPTGIPIANNCSHGPVAFDYTADPKVLRGALDGITVEARAPLDIINGAPIDPTSITWSVVAHSENPGCFRPMDGFDDSHTFTGNIPDPDGWRIQSAPIVVQYGYSQLVTGHNRNIQSTDLVLTFTPPVDGIELEAINTIDYDNRIIAYNAAGTVLASIEPTPPAPFANSGPYAIYATGIKTLRLVPALGQVYLNGISWSRLRFKKAGDPPTIPTPVVPPPPPPPPGSQIINPPLPPLPQVYIEDAYKSTDNRIHIVYSARNLITGQYYLATIATVLYPFILPIESWQMVPTQPQGGNLVSVLLYAMPPGGLNPIGGPPDAFTQVDEWKLPATIPVSGDLHDLLILHTLYDKDTFRMLTTIPQSGILASTLIVHSLYDKDSWKMSPTIPQSGILVAIIIAHTLYDKDEWKMTPTLPQATGSSLV